MLFPSHLRCHLFKKGLLVSSFFLLSGAAQFKRLCHWFSTTRIRSWLEA